VQKKKGNAVLTRRSCHTDQDLKIIFDKDYKCYFPHIISNIHGEMRAGILVFCCFCPIVYLSFENILLLQVNEAFTQSISLSATGYFR
jgi:hypothetical protein